MNGSGDDVVLLFLGELVEIYCIARNPYGELGVFFGMSLRVEKGCPVEHVYVEIIAAVGDVCVEHIYKIVYS